MPYSGNNAPSPAPIPVGTPGSPYAGPPDISQFDKDGNIRALDLNVVIPELGPEQVRLKIMATALANVDFLTKQLQTDPSDPVVIRELNNALGIVGKMTELGEAKNLSPEQKNLLASQAAQNWAAAAASGQRLDIDQQNVNLAAQRLGIEQQVANQRYNIDSRSLGLRSQELVQRQNESDHDYLIRSGQLDLAAAQTQFQQIENELDRVFSREQLSSLDRSRDVTAAGNAGSDAVKAATELAKSQFPEGYTEALAGFAQSGKFDASKIKPLSGNDVLNPAKFGAGVAANERERLAGFRAPVYTRPTGAESGTVTQPNVQLTSGTGGLAEGARGSLLRGAANVEGAGAEMTIDGQPLTPEQLDQLRQLGAA